MPPAFCGGVAVSVGAFCVLALVTLILLWDADPYAVRDRYEHYRLALFGEWEPSPWCQPGRVTENCVDAGAFEAALKDASDFTFFRSVAVGGSGVSVQTGIRFSHVRDVVDGTPSYQWCYLSLPKSGVSQQIELATKSADSPPIRASFASLDANQLAGFALSTDQLTALADNHCRFD